MRNILSVEQFLDKKLIEQVFVTARGFAGVSPANYPKTLQHKMIATLFFEPSTRTRLSFEAAAQRLGGQIISTENAFASSSSVKGESLEDTIRTVNGYADAIVLRHPDVGAAARAAKVSSTPIVNAGDGAGEHPSQALLDLYTIQQKKGRLDQLNIALVGDVLHSRTIRSLAQLISLYDVCLYFVAPQALQLPASELEKFQRQAKITQLTSYQDILPELDVLYINRIQQERFASAAEFEQLKNSFCLKMGNVCKMKADAVIMNPLPRINEIDPAVDADPRAIYFQQVANGVLVRMALLQSLFP